MIWTQYLLSTRQDANHSVIIFSSGEIREDWGNEQKDLSHIKWYPATGLTFSEAFLNAKFCFCGQFQSGLTVEFVYITLTCHYRGYISSKGMGRWSSLVSKVRILKKLVKAHCLDSVLKTCANLLGFPISAEFRYEIHTKKPCVNAWVDFFIYLFYLWSVSLFSQQDYYYTAIALWTHK